MILRLSIISPRMIGGWLGRLARNGLIEILGQNNLGLPDLLVKDIVGQGFALVKQSDLMLRIATNCDAGLAQGIARAIGSGSGRQPCRIGGSGFWRQCVVPARSEWYRDSLGE